jgi:hypothetical protein
MIGLFKILKEFQTVFEIFYKINLKNLIKCSTHVQTNQTKLLTNFSQHGKLKRIGIN